MLKTFLKVQNDCDVFINNACEDDYQIDLFNLFYNSWEDNSDKTYCKFNSIAKYLNDSNAYYENKRLLALQNAVDDVYMGAKIINVSCRVTINRWC